MPISHKYKTIFVHIPKTGGSSVEKLLGITIGKDNLYSYCPPVYQHMVPRIIKEYIEDDVWTSYYKFTIVRNPYTRIVSDYVWMQQYKATGVYGMSFNDFIKLRHKIVKNDAYATNMYYDHFIPQVEYFKDIIYDNVCYYENLKNDISEVMQKINCDVDLPHVNKTKHDESMKYYTKEDIKLVNDMYKDDFIDFNYEML
jgi:chondroitin 4-sulfotransferase 11